MIVINSVAVLIYLFGWETLEDTIPFLPKWALPVLSICAILNVVFAIALLRWKRWGFIGFVATAILTFVVNVNIRVSFFQALLGLIGVAVLYAVLQIGDKEDETSFSLTNRSELPPLPPGATPEQIAYQKQLEEREEREKTLRANPRGWTQLE
jgi:hypothetical protein